MVGRVPQQLCLIDRDLQIEPVVIDLGGQRGPLLVVTDTKDALAPSRKIRQEGIQQIQIDTVPSSWITTIPSDRACCGE